MKTIYAAQGNLDAYVALCRETELLPIDCEIIAQTLQARRKLGDRDKYLELRNRSMVYGGDFYDLASFYWATSEKNKAMQVAEEGLQKGKGRMDELRQFVAQQAKDAGNRDGYLDLQFAQTVDQLTWDNLKAFWKLCTSAEWKVYEAKILARVKAAWPSEQLRIRMHRKEYARQAQVMAKIRYLLIEVLNDNERWRTSALKVKQDNLKRPAFQEEFAIAVPGWREL